MLYSSYTGGVFLKNILVVEDEADIQELLENFLNDAGYKTSLAGDGVQALELFGSESFDMVLLDIMIPKIDGYGVCEFIRSRSNVPIIMLTALDSEDNQVKGFDLKIDDYITKPFRPRELIARIGTALRKSGHLSTTFEVKGLSVNTASGIVKKNGMEISSITDIY